MFLYPIQSIRFDAKYDLSCCSCNPGKSITPCWLQSSPLFKVVLFWTFVAVLEFRLLLALVDRLLFFPNNPPLSPSSNLVMWHLWQNGEGNPANRRHLYFLCACFVSTPKWVVFPPNIVPASSAASSESCLSPSSCQSDANHAKTCVFHPHTYFQALPGNRRSVCNFPWRLLPKSRCTPPLWGNNPT